MPDNQFPIAISQREHGPHDVVVVEDEGVGFKFVVFQAGEKGRDAGAVFGKSRTRGCFDADEVCDGQYEVVESIRDVAGAPGCRVVAVADVALFPESDCGHAMAAFVDVGFATAVVSAGFFARVFRAVVAGKDEEGVVDEFVAGVARVVVGFEVVEQLADCDVVFVYEVEAFGRVVLAAADLVALFAPFGAFPAIGVVGGCVWTREFALAVFEVRLSRDGYAVEGIARCVGCVIGVGGVVEEEGLLFCVFFCEMIIEEANGVLEVHGSGFVQVVTRDVVRVFAGCADAATVFDPARIARGSMAAVGDEVVVKAVFFGGVGQGLAHVCVVPAFSG